MAFSRDGTKLATTSADDVEISQPAELGDARENAAERNGARNQLYGARFFGVDFAEDGRVAAGTDDDVFISGI